MRVDVYESGRDDRTLGIDRSHGRFSRQVPYLDDGVIDDSDVALKPGSSRPINDLSVPDENIKTFSRLPGTTNQRNHHKNPRTDEDQIGAPHLSSFAGIGPH